MPGSLDGSLLQGLYAVKAYRQAPVTWLKRACLSRETYWRQYFWNRWGYLPPRLRNSSGRPTLWFDAQSLGEINQLRRLIPSLKNILKGCRIFISTDDLSSFSVAEQLDIDGVFDSPWDLAGPTRRIARSIRPEALIVVEHPKNPVRLAVAKRQGIRTLLISGFFTPGWERMPFMRRPLALRVFRHIDRVAAKSQEDKAQMLIHGAKMEQVDVVGDLKFDLQSIQKQASRMGSLHSETGIPFEERILVGGAVHQDEVEWLVTAWRQARCSGVPIQLVLVPRWIEHTPQFVRRLQAMKIPVALRSVRDGRPSTGRVLIVDRYGELPAWYSIAWAVFLGGSALPSSSEWGGLCHNPVEPLSFGRPVFIGSNRGVRGSICDEIFHVWSGLQVESPEVLARGLEQLAGDPQGYEKMSVKLKAIVQREDGVVERYASWISQQVRMNGGTCAGA